MIKGDKDQIAYGDRSRFVTSVRIAHGGRPSPDAFGLVFHVATGSGRLGFLNLYDRGASKGQLALSEVCIQISVRCPLAACPKNVYKYRTWLLYGSSSLARIAKSTVMLELGLNASHRCTIARSTARGNPPATDMCAPKRGNV